jgi:branched-chain amino acid transport system permease protein
VLVMLILGGMGSLRGAVIGAALFVLLKEVFQSEALFGSFAKHWQLALGVAIITLVAALPRGVTGIGRMWRQRAARLTRAG